MGTSYNSACYYYCKATRGTQAEEVSPQDLTDVYLLDILNSSDIPLACRYMPNLVELPILGLLKDGPLHGYELKRRLEGLVGYFGTVSYGSLYPMLHLLERRGQVALSGEERSTRIVYEITAKGMARFSELMRKPTVPITQKMLFFEAIPPRERCKILQAQKDEWLAKLAKYREHQGHADTSKVDRYRAALLTREIDHLEKDVIWLDRLLDEER